MDPIRSLAAIRLAVGVGAYATPGLAARLFGLDLRRNPQAPYLARLFGARDVALAVGTVQASGAARRPWLQAGLACDLADAVAALAGGRRGYLGTATTVLGTGVALTAAGLGAQALRAQPDSAPAAG